MNGERKREGKGEGKWKEKDGPGPVMVSDTLCPAVHILGTLNVHSRAKVLLTSAGPGPSFFYTKIYAGQRTRGSGPGGWGLGRALQSWTMICTFQLHTDVT